MPNTSSWAIKNNEGSIILETALIFPVFLSLLLVIINFVNAGMVYIAMDHAVGETVKQLAAHASVLSQADSSLGSLGPLEPILRQTGDHPLNVIIRETIREKIKSYYPLANLSDQDFSIIDVNIYNPLDAASQNQDIAIRVQYRVKAALPFWAYEMTISNVAVERAWIN